MAVSARLDAYLDLERTMRALDDLGDPMAEALRDALDPIWYALSDEDRLFLNRRRIVDGPAYVARLQLADDIFMPVPDPSAKETQTTTIVVHDWQCAA